MNDNFTDEARTTIERMNKRRQQKIEAVEKLQKELAACAAHIFNCKAGRTYLRALRDYCGVGKVSPDIVPASLIRDKALINLYHVFVTNLLPKKILIDLMENEDE